MISAGRHRRGLATAPHACRCLAPLQPHTTVSDQPPIQDPPISTVTFHRVTVRTKPPFLARLNSIGGRNKEPFIIFVSSLEDGYPGPPFFRSVIVSGPKNNYPDLQLGSAMNVSHFPGISRIQLTGIPKSDYRNADVEAREQ